ncbi:MAG: single-stranded DNA-binding protein [Gammaproteobacteria bacterium]|nr:single-stranded DNA-binding protein [Gammaproteobacteria bacterium]MDH5651239.1 single-stranded DNA-binding protein [Gammaproteobacteria bacterium]
MANTFKGTGNLGGDPVLNQTNEDQDQVANFSVYFDRPVKNDDGEYEDKGGFWLDVAAWGKLAEDVMRVLRRGMRVSVQGILKVDVWNDKETGEEKTKLVLTVNEVALIISRIEFVQRRQSKVKSTDE